MTVQRPTPAKIFFYVVFGPAQSILAHVVAPVLVARSGRRRGWRSGRPGRVNAAGIGPLCAGAGLIAWAGTNHFRASPDSVHATIPPDYLVRHGAYGLTRNPLYLGGASMWAGWAVLFGSPRLAGAGTAMFAVIVRLGVPFEERILARKWGDDYEAYRAEVPRWVGRRIRS